MNIYQSIALLIACIILAIAVYYIAQAIIEAGEDRRKAAERRANRPKYLDYTPLKARQQEISRKLAALEAEYNGLESSAAMITNLNARQELIKESHELAKVVGWEYKP